MELNLKIARLAIRTKEFQEFMQKEIKVTDKELMKLMSCGACWANFKWTDRTIEKINTKLLEFKNLEPKKDIFVHTSNTTFEQKIFTREQKEEALKYITDSDADSFQIVTRKKMF